MPSRELLTQPHSSRRFACQASHSLEFLKSLSCRGSIDWVDRQDFLYTIRSARRAPLLSIIAVAALSLGIGLNAGVFTLLNASFLGPPTEFGPPVSSSSIPDTKAGSREPLDSLPSYLVTALAEDSQGRLWVGTHGGLAILSNGHLQRATSPALPEGAVVQAILQDHHGTLWFGTDRGLWRFTNGVIDPLTSHDGLASPDIRVIIESASGDLWFGGYGGLTRLHDGHFSHFTEEDGLPSNNIRSLYEDGDRTLWIGTYDNGLGRLQGSHFTRYRKRDGLFSNGVFQILETRNGDLWMSSNQGIYRVDKQELNEFAEGKRRTIASTSYGRADGMINEECNGGLWPAGIKTHDGKLLFPTQDGVAAIDPDIIGQDPAPPPILIESASIDHEEVSTKAPLTMRPADENLEIEYTASPGFDRSTLFLERFR